MLKTTPMDFRVRKNGIEGSMGFHSYSNKLKWEMRDDTIFVLKKKIPFRVQNFIEYFNYYPDIRIARFHIPAGTQYAENKDGEIISSAIVFNNFIY